MRVIKPPHIVRLAREEKTIFLAGSIEMGKAKEWQKEAEDLLKDTDFVLLNPRRDDWDTSWGQSISNPEFNNQVNWELDSLDHADFILMYFDKDTTSPITLLELGHCTGSDGLVVICPEGFYRKGNVDIYCKRYGVKQVSSLEEAVTYIKNFKPNKL